MKIYIDTPENPGSKGSYRIVSDNLNKHFAKLGVLAKTDKELTHYGVCSSTHVGLKHLNQNIQNFYICAWEVSTIPDYLIQWIQNDLMIGTAKWVEDCWNRSAYNNTAHALLGCDTDFWTPDHRINKYDKFTLLCHTTSNSRSGLDFLIPTFAKNFKKEQIKLYIKDRPGSKLMPYIQEYKKKYDVDIEYDTIDATDEYLKNLYNKCHAHIYPILCTGFGMTITQTLACGLPNIVTNYSAPPEIVDKNVGLLIEGQEIPFVSATIDKMKQIGIDNYIPTEGYKYQPHWFVPDESSIISSINTMLSSYTSYKSENLYQYVNNKFNWNNTCNHIINIINNIKI